MRPGRASWSRAPSSLLAGGLRAQGKQSSLEIFNRYELATPEAVRSYGEIACSLGMSVDQVKHGLSEARTAFRDIVTSLVSEYVDGPDELAAELARLLGD